jgi:hypothetical protein
LSRVHSIRRCRFKLLCLYCSIAVSLYSALSFIPNTPTDSLQNELPCPYRKLCFKRLAKEAQYYKTEAADNESKLAAMKESGEGNVRQQEQVLDETRSMIPHSESMLAKSLEELLALVQAQDSPTDEEGEWLAAAKTVLKENGMLGDDEAAKEEAAATKVDDIKDGEVF